MKKQNKTKVLLLLLLAAGIFFIGCQYDAKKIQNKGFELEYNFSNERLLVVLNNNEAGSLNFRKYDIWDFPEIDCIKVEDLTELTFALAAKQIEAQKTGNWEELKTHVEKNMLLDLDKIKRVLCLTLEEKSHENVLESIRKLSIRSHEFYGVSPDYIQTLFSGAPNYSPYEDYIDQWAIEKIDIEPVWSITTGLPLSSSIPVIRLGILDSGISGHFQYRVNETLSGNFYDDPPTIGSNWEDISTHLGHGSSVASVAGICSWEVDLISLRVFYGSGIANSSHVARAIDYSNYTGIDILNLSGGYVIRGGMHGYDVALESSIEGYSGVFICAAGNDNADTDLGGYYPGAYYYLENVIVVGASDIDDNKCYSSNYGFESVHIFAPGEDLLITDMWGNIVDVEDASGSSFSAPFAAGAASLLKAVDPSLSALQIKNAILAGVDKVDALTGLCSTGGRLNVSKSLAHLDRNITTIIFNKNDGTDETISQKAVENMDITLKANTFTRTGYSFAGWSLTQTGEVEYIDSENYTPGALDVDLYAVWTPNSYTISFNANDGTGGPPPIDAVFGNPMPAISLQPARPGYTFEGYWDAQEGGTMYYNANLTSARSWNKANNTALHARWSGSTYIITFDDNGGIEGPPPIDAVFGSPMPAISLKPIKSGYTFIGYFDAQTGGIMYYDANLASQRNWDKANDTLLYAQWIVNIGDTGPAGGIVFYDKGYYSDGWRYLEAAPPETEVYLPWVPGYYNWYEITGNSETYIGAGKQNTQIIVDFLNEIGEHGSEYAAQYCVNMNFGGFNDWFLPSFDELWLMCENLHLNALGDFQHDWYWSSTDHSNSVLSIDFNSNWWYYHYKDGENLVRAVRSF